jgi:energy-coupling factor transporter ATP-binding protein EcfA2
MNGRDTKKLLESFYRSPFQEISFSEYLDLVRDNPSIVETSAERLYRIVSKEKRKVNKMIEYPFFRRGEHKIEGITEVLNRLVNGLYAASNSYKIGQISLLLLIGPTGSGKSEIGKFLEDALIEDLTINPRFTYYFKDEKGKIYCPFKEDPIALITDSRVFFPLKVKEKYINYKRGYLCSTCFETLNELLGKYSTSGNGQHLVLNSENMEEDKVLNILDEIVRVIRLTPQVASIELTHEKFSEMFETVIKKSNRGILNIIIDDKTISQIPNTNYQLLAKLRDARISLKDGTQFIPDVVVLLYTNAKYENITTTPLKDSLYPIFVRRNLSYTAEENIIRRCKLPFTHISPHALSILARFVVGSRINVEGDFGAAQDQIKNLENYLEIYEKYEKGEPLSQEELNKIGDRISAVRESKDGWDKGISSRAFMFELFNMETYNGCLVLENVEKYLEEKRKASELKLSAEASLKRLKNISFRDVIMAYMINILGAERGVTTLEELFSYYIYLYKRKVLDGKTAVEIPGEGMAPIDEEMNRVAKKLNLYKEDLDKAIDQYFVERGGPPTLSEILLLKPEIIYLSPELMNFVPWKEIKRGVDLNPKDKERVKKLINILKKDLGYCDWCASSVIRIFAKNMVKE